MKKIGGIYSERIESNSESGFHEIGTFFDWENGICL